MARALVVLCDVHLEEGQRVEAEELPPISIDGKDPRVLALCAQHKKDFYDPFLELVDDLARDPSDDDSDELPVGAAPESPEPERDEEEQDSSSFDDPDRVIAEMPSMRAIADEPETAQWDCPLDDCDKTYTASGDTRAEDLKRLGNLHLSRAHHLDKPARRELLSA